MLFWFSWWLHRNHHSRANVVYLVGGASAQDVVNIVLRVGIRDSGHGCWPLRQVGH